MKEAQKSSCPHSGLPEFINLGCRSKTGTQLSFGVAYGDDLASADSDPLATIVVDLRRERDRVIFAVLGVNLRDGAGGHREQIDHAPSVAPDTNLF